MLYDLSDHDPTASPNAPPAIPADLLDLRWTLSPVQWRFAHATARFSLLVGGIGSGKTTAGCLRALRLAAAQPGSLGLIAAPTEAMLRDATARTFLQLLPRRLIAAHLKSEARLTLTNGSEVLFRSVEDPDHARGLNLAWFWLDEAPLAGHYAWQVLKGRLRQRGYTTAGWATGTPHGRDNFWRDFEQHPASNHALYRAATATNLPNLPDDFIAQLGYTGAFSDQELYGLFTAFEGLVYAFEPALGGNLAHPPADPHWSEIIGGIDWGYTNPSAALVFALDGDTRVWQLDEFYQRRAALHDTLIPAILALTRRHHVRTWYCGPDEPEHIAALQTALLRAGLPSCALPAEDAVRPGIQTVTRLLGRRGDGTRGLYVAPRCVHTIAEYGIYQYPASGEWGALRGMNAAANPGPGEQLVGSVSGSPPSLGEGLGERASGPASELPLKQYDHSMDATRYALYTALGRSRATDAWVELYLRRRGD